MNYQKKQIRDLEDLEEMLHKMIEKLNEIKNNNIQKDKGIENAYDFFISIGLTGKDMRNNKEEINEAISLNKAKEIYDVAKKGMGVEYVGDVLGYVELQIHGYIRSLSYKPKRITEEEKYVKKHEPNAFLYKHLGEFYSIYSNMNLNMAQRLSYFPSEGKEATTPAEAWRQAAEKIEHQQNLEKKRNNNHGISM